MTLVLIGSALLTVAEVRSLNALSAVPAEAVLVVDVDLVALALELESERFTSTFGGIREIWRDAEIATERDPVQTAASISRWAGPSLAVWSIPDGVDGLEAPAYCIDFSVTRKKTADAEIQKYLDNEGWDATERALDKGSVWETNDDQYIGRIGRIVFICEGPVELVAATERALKGESILTVSEYASTVSETGSGPISVWVNLPSLVDTLTDLSKEDVPETALDWADRFGPAAVTLDIATEGLSLTGFINVDDPGFLAEALPEGNLSSELPVDTVFAVFMTLTDEAIDLIETAAGMGSEEGSGPATNTAILLQALRVFEGDLALAIFEDEEGTISDITGIPLDIQLVNGSSDPSARSFAFTDLAKDSGLSDFLSNQDVGGVDVTSASLFGTDIVSWAARSDVWVIGGGPVAVAGVGTPLAESAVYLKAVSTLESGMNPWLFLDAQRALNFGVQQDLMTQANIDQVEGIAAVVAVIVAGQVTDTGVVTESLVVMDW